MEPISAPQLSIITVNLNDKKGLRKTIESVTNQTFKEFEFIIIDGDSIDGSIDVIKQYQDQINCWVSEKDSGIYHAMNKGIKLAKGEYLLFLNSGDWLYNNEVLEKNFAMINHECAVYSADMFYYEGTTLRPYTNPKNLNFAFFRKATLTHTSSFIKREMFEKYGLYNEANKIASDWEFFFLILFIKGEKYQKIPLPVSVFNTSGVSHIKEMQDLIEMERKKFTEKYIPDSIQAELLKLDVLQSELIDYRKLKQKMNERRYQLLNEIEKVKWLRYLLEIPMIVLAKLAKNLKQDDRFFL